MLSSVTVIGVFCLYMGLLFSLALWTQRDGSLGRRLVDSPLVYSLSLAVYCSSWTFYGSVGLAANRGMLFLTVYLGPTLTAILGGWVWRKMIRLKSAHRITSIADFISTRYDKSGGLAALVTLIALVGITPYVALQMKAVFASFDMITAHEGVERTFVADNVGAIVVILMIVFTIMFGVRRLEPTERHEGMVMAVAAESFIKLLALLAAGVFVVYHLFDGIDDIFARLAALHLHVPEKILEKRPFSGLTWISYLVVSANAIICLPRQFHISVVENQSESHLRTAIWLLPLYLFLINLFIYPIAAAGLISGFDPSQADTFLLRVPLEDGHSPMALLVFIGGFSAATSMILISSMTMAIMISNHLLLPLVDFIPRLAFLQRRLLHLRWLVVCGFILMGYWFERQVGESVQLADIGLLSFVAFLQLAPALFGGLFWTQGNRCGAYLGLSSGFAVWSYTMLIPAFARHSWHEPSFLENGVAGLWFLKPEALFGLEGLDPVTHTVFWSLLFNVGFYILGSLVWEPTQESQSHAEAFVGILSDRNVFSGADYRQAYIPLKEKTAKIQDIMTKYFDPERAKALTEKLIEDIGLHGQTHISIVELAELYDQVTLVLGGSISAATAVKALDRAFFFTEREADELREFYGEMLADLRARPVDLKRKIDFHKEREILINKHSQELEEKVRELEGQIERRMEAEARLRESEERYRLAIEGSSDGVAVIRNLRIIFGNKRLAEIFGYKDRAEIVGRRLELIVHPDDMDKVLQISYNRQHGLSAPPRYDFKGRKKNGEPIFIAVSATTINFHGETLNLTYLRDVTNRRRSEDAIRNLSRRLIEGIEEERKRLAADLHDEFGQALTGMYLRVESLKNSLPPERRELFAQCDWLIQAIEKLAENVRNVSSELRPDMLDHLGLAPTMEWFIKDFSTRVPGLEVEFHCAGLKDRKLEPEVEISLYRILQEALNNVAKHSGADKVVVRLTYSHPQLIMVISDNGRGFDPNREPTNAVLGKAGIGLTSMRERAAFTGGVIDIRSSKGKGTVIRAALPAVRNSSNLEGNNED
ncbi:MAG: PAS domain S-box protein [Pseudomonadota bacterium]